MASPVTLKQLPWDLEEEILSHLPLDAFIRCRTVCKRWNSLFNDKGFLKNHSSRYPPQFILVTASKVYLTDIIRFDPNSIDLMIEFFWKLPSSDIPYDDENLEHAKITTCDEFFVCNNWFWNNKTALWNPWLGQVTWIEQKDTQINVVGMGYDNSRPEKVYKMLVWYFYRDVQRACHERVAVYECASHAFKSIDTPDDDWPLSTERVRRSYVSFNGNLYWVDYNLKTSEYFIQSFDFSREIFRPLCLLPCLQDLKFPWTNTYGHLAIFEGDRLSLMKICYKTMNIGIWVTKKRISYNNGDYREGEVWIKLMTLSATNLPLSCRRVSYFIDNKTIFMCSGDGDGETGMACIYVVKKDFCKTFYIGNEVVKFCHCVYAPNFISIPSFNEKLD